MGQLALQRRYGGAPMPLRLAWSAWSVFLIAPVIIVVNLLEHHVSWRGRECDLDSAAALDSEPASRHAA